MSCGAGGAFLAYAAREMLHGVYTGLWFGVWMFVATAAAAIGAVYLTFA